MAKVKAGVVRRKDGSYKAYISDENGKVLWTCKHKHRYGTSNRPHQDSASKCACAMLPKLRTAIVKFECGDGVRAFAGSLRIYVAA